MWGDTVRWFVIAESSLLDIRRQYLTLTGGFSPVPPKRMFGLYQSIFGYRSWDHVDNDLNSLIAPTDPTKRFPVDGVVLDIYWFGGKFFDQQQGATCQQAQSQSRMGDLSWDTSQFPDVSTRTAQYKKDKGVEFITIEESYVSTNTKTFPVMDRQGNSYLITPS